MLGKTKKCRNKILTFFVEILIIKNNYMACKKSCILKDNVKLQQLLPVYVLPADYNMLIN